jgi:hypothetical protein
VTFGLESTAARMAFADDLAISWYPVYTMSFMFGDSQAVVTNSTIPHSSLNKRHNALAYRRAHEMIAAQILGYYWIDGKANPVDIVSKHWSYQQIWHLLQPVQFFSGNTNDLVVSERKDKSTIKYTSMEKEEHPTRLSNH